ncbi:MAG: hypothetical protein M3P39_00700 [Actinomycetota bacterium]|nr:hypothetical protein [Actinomycetota bacterium]
MSSGQGSGWGAACRGRGIEPLGPSRARGRQQRFTRVAFGVPFVVTARVVLLLR